MDCKLIKRNGTWRDVADCARTTIGKDAGSGEPSSQWKRRMLLCEHSPIRVLNYISIWENLKSWVSVHFTRHKVGVDHFVSTRRSDRIGKNRDELYQSELVSHKTIANAQSIITMSRKRLCMCASPETREAWIEYLEQINTIDEELYSCCVPDCVYRGHCFEYKSCGYHKTDEYKKAREEYMGNINR